MICPRCQTLISDDVVICENCDFIIDTAFLGESITNEKTADEDADEEELPLPAESNRTRIKQVNLSAPKSEATPGPKTAPKSAPQSAARETPEGGTMVAAAPGPESRESARARMAAEAEEPVVRRRISLDKVAAPPSSVGETVYELRERFKEFGLSERITTVAGAVFVVSLGIPWRWTVADEDSIGLFADAWPLGIGALVVCVAAYVRRLPQVKFLKSEILIGVLVTSGLTLFSTAIYLSRSFEKESTFGARMRQVEVWKMHPDVGVFIGLLAAVVMVGGAAITLVQRNRLRD